MRVRGPEEAVRACLTRVPGVQRVTVEPLPGGELAICFVDSGGRPLAEALAAAVVAAGFGLLDMAPVHVDLETLFLGLTSGPPEERP
jgi:copper chaperone CopZ